MEIPEVQVGQEHKTKKKFLPKVQQKTHDYLGERGISKNDLTQKQWEYVAGYIKGKHYAKWGLGALYLNDITSKSEE